ncbi:MAG TPA: phenylalanine--tRNA ligase subunit beta, partial [Polyangiaceae bacterium]|nr:phenylalanine--tRNA ligase subunit beta [Polyangiaceae bacterium]
ARAVSGERIEGVELPAATITLRAAQLQRLLGYSMPFREAVDVLTRLGFRIVRISDGQNAEAVVESLAFRPDVKLEADLIEEVARVIGYDRIPTELPRIAPGAARSSGKLERKVRELAASLGLSEAVHHAFIAPRDLQKLGLPPAAVVLSNPLSEERSVMRTSLLPSLLDALKRARRHGETQVALFEVGAVFLHPRSSERSAEAQAARPLDAGDRGVLPDERPMFSAVIAGDRPAHLHKPEAVDLYDAKAVALAMIERLTGKTAQVTPLPQEHAGAHYLHPRGRGVLRLAEQDLGYFGLIHPNTADAFDLGGPALLIELDLTALEGLTNRVAKYKPIPRLPAATRDVALEVPSDIPAAQVQQIILEAGGDLCEQVALFDLFQGGVVKAGHRSLAFHVIYRDPKAATDPEHARTLTDAEVDARHSQVVKAATERFGASLRA